MGGGNGQKSKMARERNLEKQKAAGKGSQLDSNKKAMTIQRPCLGAMASASASVSVVSGSRLGSDLSKNGGKTCRDPPLPDPTQRGSLVH
ncbi:uncharacterized protein At2g23090 isoform X1 [Malania oleifera]|uniref:uncharacterized protein At2g23090 isoform X1 n=1 Tax=Malania oleifera TaxID=397392 RepID=UPI0025ADDAA9|nr:uncharacterized protein At2g23090 isoform X1 [Malania oleifera]